VVLLHLLFWFLEIEKRTFCTCNNVPIQLINLGLFPSAPLLPTLAVDLQVLDFVRELFVNAAPNITAWCNTLESFLSARSFKLITRVFFLFFSFLLISDCFQNSLWGRFTNALHWYSVLVDSKNTEISGFLNQFRKLVLASYGLLDPFDFVCYINDVLFADNSGHDEDSSGFCTLWFWFLLM